MSISAVLVLAGSVSGASSSESIGWSDYMNKSYTITHSCGRQYYKQDFHGNKTIQCGRCGEVVIDDKLNRKSPSFEIVKFITEHLDKKHNVEETPKVELTIKTELPKKSFMSRISERLFGNDKQPEFTSVVNWNHEYKRMKTE